MADNTELLNKLNDIIINENTIASQEKIKTEKINAELNRLNSIYNPDHSLRERLGEYRALRKINFETSDANAKVNALENSLIYEIKNANTTAQQSTVGKRVANPFLVIIGILIMIVAFFIGGPIGIIIGLLVIGFIFGKVSDNKQDIRDKRQSIDDLTSIQGFVEIENDHLVFHD